MVLRWHTGIHPQGSSPIAGQFCWFNDKILGHMKNSVVKVTERRIISLMEVNTDVGKELYKIDRLQSIL